MQEVDAIESEIRQMQSELAEVEELLSSPQALPKHKEEKLKVAPQGGVKYFIPSSSRKLFSLEFLNEGAFLLRIQVLGKRIQSMGTTVAEIQRCKPDLCLPDGAEETLAVFSVVDHMQTLLQDLEKVGASLAQSADCR